MPPENTPPNQPSTVVNPPAGAVPTTAPAEPVSNIPLEWPGPFGAYKYSRRSFLKNGNVIGLLLLLSFVLNIVLSALLKKQYVADNLISLLVSSLITVGMIRAMIAGSHNEKISLGQAFREPWLLLGKLIILNILWVIIAVVSFVLLVIPFLIVMPRLSLSHYYLINENRGILEALEASWHATKGHVSKVYGIIGAMILMMLLALTIIGIPFSIYFLFMYSAVFAVLYGFVTQQSAPAAAAPVSPAPQPLAA